MFGFAFAPKIKQVAVKIDTVLMNMWNMWRKQGYRVSSIVRIKGARLQGSLEKESKQTLYFNPKAKDL